jgi:hypothetical protein
MVGDAGVKARLTSTACGRVFRPPGAGVGQKIGEEVKECLHSP